MRKMIVITCFMIIPFILFQNAWKQNDNVSLNNIKWNEGVNFTAGDCDSNAYTAWCPHNLQYDAVRDKFIFLQCHATNHADSKFSKMTLCYLNPENPLWYEEINCPIYEGLGALLVNEQGEWYIWTEEYRYCSNDAGISWTEQLLETPLQHRYGVYDIDGVLYMGDDSSEQGVYYISYDYGISWLKESFGISYRDCEASFCKFKGEIYAFLRTNSSEFACILKKSGDGWSLVNDDCLKAGASDCSVVAFDDFITIAHISRTDMHLYYTVWNGEDSFITKDLGLQDANSDNAGDFHSPSLAFGNGYVCIAYMLHTYGSCNSAYYECQNQWMIGAYEQGKKFLRCDYKSSLLFTVLAGAIIDSDFYPDGSIVSTIKNSNKFDVTLTSEKLNKYSTLHYPNGGIVPIRHGCLAAYGTKGAPIPSEIITIDFLFGNQQYPVVNVDGTNIMCIRDDSKEMVVSMQRKTEVYDSSVLTEFAEYTENVQKAFYMERESFVAVSPFLEYCTIESSRIKR